jgi:hypothetical protein
VPYIFYQSYGDLDERGLAELSMHDTFDALTPKFDNPLTADEFFGEIRDAGFRIDHTQNDELGPLWCTAVRS